MASHYKNEHEEVVSDVPAHLLHGKTDSEVWMYEQQSIQRQLIERVAVRLKEGEARFEVCEANHNNHVAQTKAELEKLHGRIAPFEKMKEQWTGKKAVLSFIFVILLIPLGIAIVTEVAKAGIQKFWH